METTARAQHTPGPWKAKSLGFWVQGADGSLVADCVTEHNKAEKAANACLIASAPSLLAALEEIVASIEDYSGSLIPHMVDIERIARAAIAQAHGDA